MDEVQKGRRQMMITRVSAASPTVSGIMILAGVVLLMTSVIGGWLVGMTGVVFLSLGAMLLAACLAVERGNHEP